MKYYPSPFRKDYIKNPTLDCPIKNLSSKTNTHEQFLNKNQSSHKSQRNHHSQGNNNQFASKGTIYQDGMMYGSQKYENYGIFLINWPGSSEKHYSDLGVLFYALGSSKDQKKRQTQSRNRSTQPGEICAHGKNYMFFCNGVRITANYQFGVLNKWLIGYFPSKFVMCYQYRNGVKEGKQYYYDCKQNMVSVSHYRKGTLQTIENIFMTPLQKIIQQKQLLDEIQSLKNLNPDLPKHIFPSIKINKNLLYLGNTRKQADSSLIPDGIGFMGNKDNSEIFLGHFNYGFLSGIGFMNFSEDSYYFGEINNQGNCVGYGCYYNNERVIYKFSNEDIRIEEFKEFLEMRVKVKGEKKKKFLEKFKEMIGLGDYLRDKLDLKLQYEDYSIRKLSIKKHRSLNKSEISDGVSIEFDDIQQTKNNDKKKSTVFQYNIYQPQLQSAKPKAQFTEFQQQPKSNNFAKKQPNSTNIITLNSRQDIRYQQKGLQNDYISQEQTLIKPKKFASQSNFTKTVSNPQYTNSLRKKNQVKINLGNIYHQDSSSVEESEFYDALYRS